MGIINLLSRFYCTRNKNNKMSNKLKFIGLVKQTGSEVI